MAQMIAVPKRFYAIGIAAFLMILLSSGLGVYLGMETQHKFREVEASWVDHNGDVGQKGVWISTIRGHLGYGGIIHNFKNYVLRRDPAYLETAVQQVTQFNTVIEEYLAHSQDPNERKALRILQDTIAIYDANFAVAQSGVREGISTQALDQMVKVDDSAAKLALAQLEKTWTDARLASTTRVFAAVEEGRALIAVGFASVAGLVLASISIGTIIYLMFHDMGHTLNRLSDELDARRAAEASEHRLASVVEQSPATIIITDRNAKILYANKRFLEVTGWSSAEIFGKSPKFLQSGDTSDDTYLDLRQALEEGRDWHGTFRNRKKDGGIYWTDTLILPLRGPDGEVHSFVGIGEDITERRQAREQVARAQKLEAVGLLAGGIAHDFNNVLTTIIGAAHLAALDAPEGSDLAGEIDQIEIAAKRAQSLVRGLLTFARREPGQSQPVDLDVITQEVQRLLRASVPPTLRIEVDQTDGPHGVLADPTHLHQIVMNIVRNAAEAIGVHEGVVRLTAHRVTETPDGLRPLKAGWMRLTIQDNGPGMSAEVRRRLFDPFFTTKPLGKGSGLGLVVVAGLVEEMGGRVLVDSVQGQGARFDIFLPATDLTTVPDSGSEAQLPRGKERILVVDDETEIAATWRRLLMRLGYRVEAYTSPVIALEKYAADPGRFDAVITDMVMPDMSGATLATQIRRLRPGLPVIICTGYSPSAINVEGPAPVVLDKPVDPARLAQQLRSVLDPPVSQAKPPSQTVTLQNVL
ncbi:PAS domain S-box protein [Epibacterium sp. SM1979]|uniref:histidine kinase n=1 Tax=Tritonibacter litoralis TaxID=2662264 RepID=A0A843YDI6_9RHOB|nr:PAS domain S-box protein [Tritonibacter litoralis]MQQ07129.1 PAS domain S-box protein [Tritonibacter litoralis]